MSYYRLKEEHPLQQKVRELEHIMDEMGIYISVGVGGQLFVIDQENPDEPVWYLDSEHSVGGYEQTQQFPLGFETKLVIERD